MTARIRRHLSTVSASNTIDYQSHAARTDGLSGADIKVVCREAAMMPLRRLMEVFDPHQIKSHLQTGTLQGITSSSVLPQCPDLAVYGSSRGDQ